VSDDKSEAPTVVGEHECSIKLHLFDPGVPDGLTGASKAKTNQKVSSEDMSTIIQAHYRNCHGVILCFDLSNKMSFLNIEKWVSEAKESVNENCKFILVGTKADLPPDNPNN